MWIANGYRAKFNRLAVRDDGVTGLGRWGIERQRLGLEVRNTHLDTDAPVIEKACVRDAADTFHRHCTVPAAAAPMQQCSQTTRAVAGLFDFTAIGIDD